MVLILAGLSGGVIGLAFWQYRRPFREHIERAMPWEPKRAADEVMVLPGQVVRLVHPRRERGACTCLAHQNLREGSRLLLGLSPDALDVRERRAESTTTVPLRLLRAATLVEQAYGVLAFGGSSFTTDVDNMPIPTARRHRIRITFADQSYAEITSPRHHNARRFLEIFERLQTDVPLRLLSAIGTDRATTTEQLAETVGVSPERATAHVRDFEHWGVIRRSADGFVRTERGDRGLAELLRDLSSSSRVVMPPAPKDLGA